MAGLYCAVHGDKGRGMWLRQLGTWLTGYFSVCPVFAEVQWSVKVYVAGAVKDKAA